MIVFPLLCAVSVLAGLGVLSALGLPVSGAQRWLLAPGVCLVVWAIGLGIGVSLGEPVRSLALPFWGATAVLGGYGAWRAKSQFTLEAGGLLLLALVLPAGLMMFDFAQGLANFIGGPAGDGWSYVAQGQRLWEMPKEAVGHLAPLYQYASHLHRNRFVASALLGVFSLFAGQPGDTQAAAGYLIAWSLFVYAASCAAAAIGALRRPLLLVFCALAVASRWVLGAIEVHNYDNLIAISFFPIAVGMLSGVRTMDWRAVCALGALFAASIYGYPEMAPFVGLGTALAVAGRVAVGSRPWVWIAGVGVAMGLTALLLLPAWPDLIWYVANQVSAAGSALGARAGEYKFVELLSARQWPRAIWGLSDIASVRFGTAWGLASHTLGTILCGLALAGCARLLRRPTWPIAVTGVVLIVGAAFMAFHEQYSYGAYKFLLLGWWIVAWCAVAGASWFADVSTSRLTGAQSNWTRVVPGFALAVVLLAVFGSIVGRIVTFRRGLQATSVQPFRAVLDVERVIGREPLILAVDNDLANEWAVYFLRQHPMRLFEYRGYMAFDHVVPVMQQAAAPDLTSVKYVLSDGPPPANADVPWRHPPYIVWGIPSVGAAFLRHVTNPNGSETMDGQSFYWIGRGDTELDVFATSAGEATFSGRFMRGPSLPGQPERHLLVGGSGEMERRVTIGQDGDQSFLFSVHAGDNHLFIRPLDRPSPVVNAGGDTRPLLLGVQGIGVSLQPRAAATTSSCSLDFTSGWYGKETSGAGWLRWSSGAGQLTITSRAPVDLVLRGEVLSFTRPNTATILADGIQTTEWRIDDPAWTFHAFPPLAVHVGAGQRVVLRVISQAAPVRPPSDPRPLALALSNLTLSRNDDATSCEVTQDSPPMPVSGARQLGAR